jgi:hypothetical protein
MKVIAKIGSPAARYPATCRLQRLAALFGRLLAVP